MSFDIKVDGVVVHTIDVDPRQVVGVSLRTSGGEEGVAGLAFNEDSVNLEIKYQIENVLPILEDDVRLAKAEAVQNGDVTEKLFTNENSRRIEALKALALDHADYGPEDGDMTEQFAIEREEVIQNPEITAQAIQDGYFVDKGSKSKSSKSSKDKDLAFNV